MKILVIGSGGREHSLVWSIAASPLCEKIFCAAGNAGVSDLAECVKIKAKDTKKIIQSYIWGVYSNEMEKEDPFAISKFEKRFTILSTL